MSGFAIDIERFVTSQREKFGLELRGFACIQYPIYCAHTRVSDWTRDPMASLDECILGLLVSCPSLSDQQIATLTGASRQLVSTRIQSMVISQLLDEGENSLTEKGASALRLGFESIEREIALDFYVDGIDFTLLGGDLIREFGRNLIGENNFHYYTDETGETKIATQFNPDIVHTPFEEEVFIRNLYKIPVGNRTDYGIPEMLEEVLEVSFTRMTLPIFISLSVGENGIVKSLVNGFAIDGSNEGLDGFRKYLDSRVLKTQFTLSAHSDRLVVTNNWGEIDKKVYSNPGIFSFSRENLRALLEEHYGCDLKPENVLCHEVEIGILVTEAVLSSCRERNRFVRALQRGRDYQFYNAYTKGAWLLFFFFRTGDAFCDEMIDLIRFVDESPGNADILKIQNFNANQSADYRKLLTFACRFDLLEKLAIAEHMGFENEEKDDKNN